jgi:polar amino acid transport system substrate-binding protein
MIRMLLALLLLCASAVARADDITLSNGEWLPFQSEHLRHYGVLSRIVSEAFALEGVTVHYVFRPWPRALAEAKAGAVQGSIVWSEGPPGSTRRRDFHFSDLVFEGKSVFFYRKGMAFNWTTFDDLVRYKIGGVAGYEYLFQSVPGIKVDRAATDELCMRKLLAGRFDLFPTSLEAGRYLLRTRFSASEAASVSVHKGAYNVTRYHLILPRALDTSPRYLELFNKGLKKLKDSGRYAQYMDDLAAGKY